MEPLEPASGNRQEARRPLLMDPAGTRPSGFAPPSVLSPATQQPGGTATPAGSTPAIVTPPATPSVLAGTAERRRAARARARHRSGRSARWSGSASGRCPPVSTWCCPTGRPSPRRWRQCSNWRPARCANRRSPTAAGSCEPRPVRRSRVRAPCSIRDRRRRHPLPDRHRRSGQRCRLRRRRRCGRRHRAPTIRPPGRLAAAERSRSAPPDCSPRSAACPCCGPVRRGPRSRSPSASIAVLAQVAAGLLSRGVGDAGVATVAGLLSVLAGTAAATVATAGTLPLSGIGAPQLLLGAAAAVVFATHLGPGRRDRPGAVRGDHHRLPAAVHRARLLRHLRPARRRVAPPSSPGSRWR